MDGGQWSEPLTAALCHAGEGNAGSKLSRSDRLAESDGTGRAGLQADQKFPKEELFGLSLQIRKAVVSVPSNIAEGQGRNSTKEFLRHLFIAYGSLMETETHDLVAEMQEYITAEESK